TLVLLPAAPHGGDPRRLRRAAPAGPLRHPRGGRARAAVGGRAQREARFRGPRLERRLTKRPLPPPLGGTLQGGSTGSGMIGVVTDGRAVEELVVGVLGGT